MKLINGNPFVNLEEYLDMDVFGKLEDKLSYMLAKNSNNFESN